MTWARVGTGGVGEASRSSGAESERVGRAERSAGAGHGERRPDAGLAPDVWALVVPISLWFII